jgi:hypothetical protein
MAYATRVARRTMAMLDLPENGESPAAHRQAFDGGGLRDERSIM